MSLNITVSCDFCYKSYDGYEMRIIDENVLGEVGRLRRIVFSDGWGYRNHRYYCPSCAKERNCPTEKESEE